MLKNILLLVALQFASIAQAQFIKKQAVNLQIGYGVGAPENREGVASLSGGFYGQIDWILITKTWLELRPYIGLISTNVDEEEFLGDPPIEKAETRAALLGGKLRLRVPIPYISPFLELGVGASIGSFDTSTLVDTIDKRGITPHFTTAFGLGLGKKNGIDLALAFYQEQEVKQVIGVFYLGLRIPL
jgi:hypothetical protein